MKINETFTLENNGGECVLRSEGGRVSYTVTANPTAALVLELLSQETSLDEIADSLFEKFDAPREVIFADVSALIGQLREIGAIDD